MIAEKCLFFKPQSKIITKKPTISTILKNNALEKLLKIPDLYKPGSNYKILENKILNSIKQSYGFCTTMPQDNKEYESGLLFLFNFEINRLSAWDKNVLSDTIVQTVGGLTIFDHSGYDFLIKIESKKLKEMEVYSSTKFSLNNINIIAVNKNTRYEEIIMKELSLIEIHNMIANMSVKKETINYSTNKQGFKCERRISDVSAGV